MQALPKLLITGFEPFGGDSLNPSWEVARALDGATLGGWRVAALQLPCVFGASRAALDAGIRRLRPVAVLALGLAGNRSAISVERVALNLIDARIADNAGAQPVDVPVIAGAPLALATRLPAKAIVAQLQASGLRAELSLSAGSFVCNELMFGLLHRLRRRARRACRLHPPATAARARGAPLRRPAHAAGRSGAGPAAGGGRAAGRRRRTAHAGRQPVLRQPVAHAVRGTGICRPWRRCHAARQRQLSSGSR